MQTKRYTNEEGRKRFIKTKVCKECGSTFNPSRTTQTYCGYKCSNSVINRKKKELLEVTLTCLTCKKVFTKRPSDMKIYPGSASKTRNRYCSQKCWHDTVQSVSSLKKKVWAVFSMYIKMRDNWTCFTCGKYEQGRNMHGGHFISRRYNATIFDERNVHAQCAGCNMFRNGELHLYAQKLIELHGHDWFDKLVNDGKAIKKFTKPELLELLSLYREKVKSLDSKDS